MSTKTLQPQICARNEIETEFLYIPQSEGSRIFPLVAVNWWLLAS